MEDKFISVDMMDEIRRLYTPPPPPKPLLKPRAYYDPKSMEIICFSREEMTSHPYVEISEMIYMTPHLDWFKIENDRVVRRDQFALNRLQLRPNGCIFASVRGDMQFAVSKDWAGEKDTWDVNH
jgi:hypothetical protein